MTPAARLRRQQRRLDLKASYSDGRNELHFIADGVGIIEAAAGSDGAKIPTLDGVVYSGGLLRVDGFNFPVVLDIPTLKAAADQYPLLLNHRSTDGVGHHVLDMSSGRQIKAAGVLSIPGTPRDQVMEARKNGFKWTLSVHARIDPAQTRFIPRGQTLTANGQTFNGPVIYARNGLYIEASFVPLGGDDHASAHLAASASTSPTDPAMNPELEAFIKAAGKDPTKLTQTEIDLFASALAGSQKLAETETEEEPADKDAILAAAKADTEQKMQPVLDELKKLREDRERETLERELTARAQSLQATGFSMTINSKEVNLLAHAREQKWNADRFELEFRRESRQSAPQGFAHSSDRLYTRENLSAALMLKGGVRLDSPAYRNEPSARFELQASLASCGAIRPNDNFAFFMYEDVNAASRNQVMDAAWQLKGLSLPDICRLCARMDGSGDIADPQKAIRAALSGNTASFIFTTSFNAQMLAGWDEVPDMTMGWVRENTNVPNFLPYQVGTVRGQTELTLHQKGVPAEHAAVGDDYEEGQIYRFSRQFTCDEIDLINDRFGSLQDTPPTELGRAARRVRPRMVYTILLNNPAMRDTVALFHADHSNLRTSSALNSTNLKAALAAFQTTQENGVNLNLMPTDLILGVGLRFDAEQIVNSTTIPGSTVGGQNPLAGCVDHIIADANITNGVVDPVSGSTIAGSTTAWWLADRKNPAIECAYLRSGSRTPGVVTWRKNGEEGQYLIGFSVKHDIGAKAIRTATIQKNTP